MSSTEITKKDFIKSLIASMTTKSSRSQFQARDYEIMRFILEQKFCSLEAIYFRYFDKRTSQVDKLPKNLSTTRQRLSKLRTLGLLKTEKVLSSGRAHFLLTPLGFKILEAHTDDVLSMQPTKNIDFSLYEHDVRITMIRALTEAKGKCRLWYSEKWLKAQDVPIGKDQKYHFAKDLRPDALLVNSKGERIALELEVARKAKSRLTDKIRLYDDLMEENYRSNSGSEQFKVIDKVWFIATKPVVVRFLQMMIQTKSRHPLCYRVDFFDEIVPECARG